MKKWIVLTVAALSVASLSFAEGRPGKRSNQDGQQGSIAHLLDKPQVVKKLGITDEQVAALKENTYASQKELIALRAERDAARVDLRHMMDADEIDEGEVMDAVEKMGAINTELHKSRVKSQLETIEILGKETHDKLQTMRQNKRERKGKRDGKKGRRAGLGDRDAQGEDAPPWMQDEMPPPDDEI